MDLKEQMSKWNKRFLDYSTGNDFNIHGDGFYRNMNMVNGKVLDVGCGDFHYLIYVEKPEDTYLVGLDISKMALKLTKRIIKEKDNKKIDIVLGTAQYLPFREDIFDEVLCIELLQDTGNDYQQILREIQRTSKSKVSMTLHHHEFNEKTRKSFNEAEATELIEESKLRIEKMKIFKAFEIFDVPYNRMWPSEFPPADAKMIMQIECTKEL